MDFLEGKLLMNIDEPVTAEDRIRDGVLVLYYFVSMDCDRCRTFDDELAKVYSRAMRKEKDILVVVVPTDDSGDNIEVMNSYPQWYMIPFEDELRVILRYNFGVTHVPQLIVVRKDGELVTRCGRAEVEEIGINVLITWSE
ncbi:UNVERIFIED_CONTAM: hypothetical protein PYX00_000325 [Menopon gallinae]|uniref:Thioredoxin-like fold domain-containing protein n=1 Tax=Menopon gallinae TaxID=328185 RepID=A0AAW2I8H8_9NEOP